MLDDILHDDKHMKAISLLETCLTKNMLLKICQCKGTEDYTVYKLDEEKLMNWLMKKVSKLSIFLELTKYVLWNCLVVWGTICREVVSGVRFIQALAEFC